MKKLDDDAKYAAFRAAKMIELFGPPPLLSSEREEVYKNLLAGLGEDFGPKSTTEMMYVRDFADFSWEIFRYRRYKSLVLERRVRRFREAQAVREKKRAREGQAIDHEEQEGNQPQTKRERAEELACYVIDVVPEIDEIHANGAEELDYVRAFESALKEIQMIETMENFKVAQRESILRQLAVFREGWGDQLRQSWDHLEQEFLEANPHLKTQTDPLPSSEVKDALDQENRSQSH